MIYQIGDKLRTPRGTLSFKFQTLDEANEAGFSVWFSHPTDAERTDYFYIVNNGTEGYAVLETQRARRVFFNS
ncbi:MAG: hypothetical protein LBN33_03010 [Desulfovibrio sp.]|jgi:hypothetical protein|nr:hypothetical protein [Desulfovibrio sp.]